MFFSNIKNVASLQSLLAAMVIAIGISLLTPILSSSVHADTTVNLLVCGPDLTSSLGISTPPSDSVTDNSQVPISGTVSNATQIDSYVDGAFNDVIPLSVTDTSYATSISLSPGTHTISLTAINACNLGNVTQSVILTYQPAAVPSTGGNVPTTTPGQPNGPGTGNKLPVQGSTKSTLSSPQQVLNQAILKPLKNAASELNLDTIDTSPLAPSRPPVPNYIRFMLLIVGTVLILASAPLSLHLMRLARRLHIHLLASAKAMYEERITLIVTGLVSIFLMFTV